MQLWTYRNSFSRLFVQAFLLIVFGVGLCSSLSAQPNTVDELRREGAFGFPAESSQTHCDTDSLRVQTVCDSERLLLQAVFWNDDNDELGETKDGRSIGDTSSIVFDVAFDRKKTNVRDRTYTLNPWPAKPGLQYSFPLGLGSSHIQTDSKGAGAIRYLSVSDGRKVRVDTYLIPLAELFAEPNSSIGIGFLGQSQSPKFVLNSIGYQSKREQYYSFSLPFEDFTEVKLVPTQQALDVSQIPDGRKDKKRAMKPKVKPLLKVGQVPPELAAKGWLGTDTPPKFSQLRGKVVLVDFWATWCGPCVAGIPDMNELHAKYGDDGLVVLGITDQSLKGIVTFQEKVKMDYPVGVGSEAGAEFGATALPHAFIIGRDGNLFWEGLPSDDDFESKLKAALDATVAATIAAPAPTPAPAQAKPTPEADASIQLNPGSTFRIEFPDLGMTWRDVPAKAGVYLPTDYNVQGEFPLFVWFAGGAGTDAPAKAAAITGGKGFICVALPYRTEADDNPGGWQTPWSFYKTMLDKIESIVPNLDADRRVCGGFSSGGAAILHQIGNSEHAFQEYFYAFMPGGAGWPMGELASIKGRPMLAFMGENDKRLPNFQKLEEAATDAGVDFTFLKFPNVGHKFPESTHADVRNWMTKHVVDRKMKATEPASSPVDRTPASDSKN